jgi:predicted ATPase/DNA-binding SARP family transcriptional activator
MLEICLFGRPRFRIEGDPLAFRAPPRALTLLAHLLLQRDRPFARDTLAVAFWPDVGESEARARLRTHLHYLIEIFPKIDVPWLLADKRTVQWNAAAPAWVDVVEFERLARDPAMAAQAAELYTGDLLAGVDDECLESPRARLRERQIGLLLDLIVARRSAADLAGAIPYALQLLDVDPWREDGVRNLIELRSQAGDRAGALQMYRRFAKRLKEELGEEPMPETIRVYDAALSADPAYALVLPATKARASDNLPAYLTTFVGRVTELAALQAALAERRLVTLVGTGGVGKTRLAVEAARTLTARFAGGAWLVELAACSQDEHALGAIASALGLADRSESGLLELLQRRRALLVLDNCEHLPGLARIVELIVTRCHDVRVLATSREPLHVSGERVERLAPLPVPVVRDGQAIPSLDDLRESPAVQLLLDRLADVSTPVDLPKANAEDRRALAAISRRLDGIPLAIELAAPRANTLTLSALARRLDESFAFLTGGGRAGLPRHQTLRAAIDWSYDALGPLEQRAFARVGAFTGSWDLRAAATVCGDLEVGARELADILESLVFKSLVVAGKSSGDVRYRLLETMRAYALEKLEAEGVRLRALHRHAQYYSALLCEFEGRGAEPGSFEALARDLQNVRAALLWTIEAGNDPVLGASLAASFANLAYTTVLSAEALNQCDAALAALGRGLSATQEAGLQFARAKCFAFLQTHAPVFVAERRAVELLRKLGDKPQVAYAMSYLADALRRAGLHEEGRKVAADALEEARDAGDMRVLAHVLTTQSRLAGNLGTKQQCLLEALDACRSVAYKAGVVNVLMHLGECAFEAGDPRAALAYARDCIAMLREEDEGEGHPLSIVLNNAAAYAIAVEAFDDAGAFANIALGLANRLGDQRREAWAFQHLGAVALSRGQVRRAARLLGASNERLGAGVEQLRAFTERSGYEQTLAKLRDLLNETDLDDLIEDGQRLSAAHAAM